MLVTRDRCRFDWKEKWFAAATHVVNSTEPPGADPHARWCGRGAVARPPIPIFSMSGPCGLDLTRKSGVCCTAYRISQEI